MLWFSPHLHTFHKQDKDEEQSLALQDKEGRNKVAAMAFKKLFPNLPAHVQEEWNGVKNESRAKATDWLNKRMVKKKDSTWVFSLANAERLAKQNTSIFQEGKSQALKKAVPRFRAIAKARGEVAFKQALQDGEIVEVKGQDNKPMFMWKEELLQVGTAYSSGTEFSQSEQMSDFQDFSSMVDTLHFQGDHMACQWQQFQPQAVRQQRQQLALPAPPGFNANMGNQMMMMGNFASGSNQSAMVLYAARSGMVEPGVSEALWNKLDEAHNNQISRHS